MQTDSPSTSQDGGTVLEAPPPELRGWVVQVGSFARRSNAETLTEQLRGAGFTTFVEPVKLSDRELYRVRVGPELDRHEAASLRDRLNEEMKIVGQLQRYP